MFMHFFSFRGILVFRTSRALLPIYRTVSCKSFSGAAAAVALNALGALLVRRPAD